MKQEIMIITLKGVLTPPYAQDDKFLYTHESICNINLLHYMAATHVCNTRNCTELRDTCKPWTNNKSVLFSNYNKYLYGYKRRCG